MLAVGARDRAALRNLTVERGRSSLHIVAEWTGWKVRRRGRIENSLEAECEEEVRCSGSFENDSGLMTAN